ncbi:unnamed protein product [Effrenium voratum]|nr:unnamed protein product [Effrenium voratum]CAJ1436806.1 unnamed protein product [Effrenium voratum]
MGLSCSAVFHPELSKQALQRPEPPELHGHLVVLSLTDDAPETITAELGLLISRQHAPKPAAPSRGPPQLTRFLSAAPAPSLPTGKPKLQRLTSEGTRSGAEALGVKWSDRWTLPPVTLRPKTEAPVHLGLLDLRDLEAESAET